MRYEFGFGHTTQSVDIDPAVVRDVLLSNPVPRDLTGEAEVRRALSAPIGSAPLRELVKPGEKIAIVTSDISRPMPSWKALPPVLDELYAAGARAEDITLVFALGIGPASWPGRRSAAWTPTPPTAYIWVRPPGARR